MREKHSLLDIVRTPDLAVEVTLQPVRRLGVDAAILFSDIVVPLEGMGVELDIVPGVGPVISDPISNAADVAELGTFDPQEHVPYVIDTIKAAVGELDAPLIGFGGAPFTLASYLIEGGPSKDHAKTKALMYSDAATWDALMGALSDAVLTYLEAQVAAGASAVQLFDSWVGHLAPRDYEARVLPWTKRIFTGLAQLGVPLIHFGVGTGELLTLIGSSGASVVGIDWRVPLDVARTRLPAGMVVQGNLDPALCLAPWDVVEGAARDVLQRGGRRGHVFNLGHGVLPRTDPAILERLVAFVHSWPLESEA